MKRWPLVVALLLCAARLEAAIAFEHSGSGKTTSASTTGPSFSVTCDGSSGEKLVLVIGQQSATASATYNSIGMTQVPTNSPSSDSGYFLRMFTLDSPSSGSNTVAITFGSAIVANAAAACYSGTATGLDSSGKADTGGVPADTLNVSSTVVASNCWQVMGVVNSGGPIDPTAGTSTTLRVAISDANTISLGLFDSNGTVGTGSQTLQGKTTAPSFEAGVLVAMKPPSGGSTCDGGLLLRRAGKGC